MSKQVWEYSCVGNRKQVPPILFFEKPRQGVVKFCGIVIINGLSIEWFSDD